MTNVKVIKNHSYGGRRRTIGDVYSLPYGLALMFRRIGRVREEFPPVVKKPIPQAIATSEWEADNEQEPTKPKRRRRYKRRDMRAEGETCIEGLNESLNSLE